MKKIKQIVRGAVPNSYINGYHRLCAGIAARLYGFPASKMLIVGVTGTKGKTSTSNYIWSVLHAGGYAAGLMTTANFRIKDREEINTLHMSMPNAFIIQKKLSQMRRSGVRIVVIEMTSEGMRQYRHAHIPVDIAVFTNLTPEHIASHGSFEAYKEAKGALFKALNHSKKNIFGMISVPPTILANADNEHSEYYLSFPADKKIMFGLKKGDIRAEEIQTRAGGTFFSVSEDKYQLSIPGAFNVYNALPAILVGRIFSISQEKIALGLRELSVIPGRMEIIDEGQPFTVIVDFAHEAASMGALVAAARSFKKPNGRILLLSGAAGGGRERRPMTAVAAKSADILVLTNEDSYQDDPASLIAALIPVAEAEGKKCDHDLFAIPDRREAIARVLSLAGPDDIVLISGKGSEQVLVTQSGSIPWDERSIVRELTKKYGVTHDHN